MRRLENEQLLLDHLASYEITWVNERFKELTKSDLTHKFFLKHLELELRNITDQKFNLSMFYRIEYNLEPTEYNDPLPSSFNVITPETMV